jgi:hypothetical protein
VKTIKTKNDFYPKTYKERWSEPILQNKLIVYLFFKNVYTNFLE